MVMLSENYRTCSNSLQFPAFSQLKIDGNRCIFKNNRMYSKNGKEIFNVKHITSELINCPYKLDGELYSLTLNFCELNGMCKLKESTMNSKRTCKSLIFIVFDIITVDTYKIRLEKLTEWMDDKKLRFSFLIPTTIVNSYSEVDELIIQKHYIFNSDKIAEGIMLKNYNGIYTYSRSKDSLKYKLRDDSEFIIVSSTQSKNNKTIFTFYTSSLKDITFNAIAHFLDYSNVNYAGKLATVSFQELDELQTPRFPIVKSLI
jgi:ATP-dependent DNA ligase